MKLSINRIYKPKSTWEIKPFNLYYTKYAKISWLGFDAIFLYWGFSIKLVFGWPWK